MIDNEVKSKNRGKRIPDCTERLVSVFDEFKKPFFSNYSLAQCKNKVDFFDQILV